MSSEPIADPLTGSLRLDVRCDFQFSGYAANAPHGKLQLGEFCATLFSQITIDKLRLDIVGADSIDVRDHAWKRRD